MAATSELWHPAGEIYISRPVADPMFEYITEQLRTTMGPNAHFSSLRDGERAAVTLINQAEMRYALRKSPRLRQYSAAVIENELLEAVAATRETFYRAQLGEVALLENPDNPLKTLIVRVDEPDIVNERKEVRETVNRLAGTPVFEEDEAGAHVSYAQFTRRPSDRALQKFKAHHVHDTYKVDVVKSKPL